MTESELELMRLKARVQLLQSLVLELAINPPLARPPARNGRGDVIGPNRRRLPEWLESEKKETRDALLRAVKDPALSDLFEAEFREIVEEMVSFVRTFNAERKRG